MTRNPLSSMLALALLSDFGLEPIKMEREDFGRVPIMPRRAVGPKPTNVRQHKPTKQIHSNKLAKRRAKSKKLFRV